MKCEYGERRRVGERALRGGGCERVARDEAQLVESSAQIVKHVELHEALDRHEVVAAARALLDARLERRLRSAHNTQADSYLNSIFYCIVVINA